KKKQKSRKQKRSQKSNKNYYQSSEPKSSDKSTEDASDNKDTISDISKNLSQISNFIPDRYRPLSKKSASKLHSEIWKYFHPLEQISTGNHVRWCPLEDHLFSIHGITRDSNSKSKKQLKIDIIFKTVDNNSKRKQNQDQTLVEWIIDNAQPLYIVESQKFKAFIATLDPYYEFPTCKLRDTAISCLLTCDLWTSKSHEAYLSVTCHWIDPNFKLNEILLTITPCPYPYITENIYDNLFEIMNNWNISNK
ncbi:7541_t:CDS:2, partial [Cetraspora pellucida]